MHLVLLSKEGEQVCSPLHKQKNPCGPLHKSINLRVDISRGCHSLFQNGVEDGHQTVQGERFGPQQLMVRLQQNNTDHHRQLVAKNKVVMWMR